MRLIGGTGEVFMKGVRDIKRTVDPVLYIKSRSRPWWVRSSNESLVHNSRAAFCSCYKKQLYLCKSIVQNLTGYPKYYRVRTETNASSQPTEQLVRSQTLKQGQMSSC